MLVFQPREREGKLSRLPQLVPNSLAEDLSFLPFSNCYREVPAALILGATMQPKDLAGAAFPLLSKQGSDSLQRIAGPRGEQPQHRPFEVLPAEDESALD